MCNKALVSWYRCKGHSPWGRGGERWVMVAILISFPSSLSLMKYKALISFSAFSSIRAQKLLEGTFTKTVWPSQRDTKHMVGAERPFASLPLPSAPEAEGRVWCGAQPPTAARCLHECTCSWPTFAAKSQPCRNLGRRNPGSSQYHFASVRCSCCCFPLWPVPRSLQVFGYGHFPVKLVVCWCLKYNKINP